MPGPRPYSNLEFTGSPEDYVYQDPDGSWYTSYSHHSYSSKFAAVSAVRENMGLPPLDDDYPTDEDWLTIESEAAADARGDTVHLADTTAFKGHSTPEIDDDPLQDIPYEYGGVPSSGNDHDPVEEQSPDDIDDPLRDIPHEFGGTPSIFEESSTVDDTPSIFEEPIAVDSTPSIFEAATDIDDFSDIDHNPFDDGADAYGDDQQVIYGGKAYDIRSSGYEIVGHSNVFTAYSVYRGPHYLGKVFRGADDRWYSEPGPDTGLTYSNPAIAAIQNNLDRLYVIGDLERAKETTLSSYEDVKPPERSRPRGGNGGGMPRSARPRIRN